MLYSAVALALLATGTPKAEPQGTNATVTGSAWVITLQVREVGQDEYDNALDRKHLGRILYIKGNFGNTGFRMPDVRFLTSTPKNLSRTWWREVRIPKPVVPVPFEFCLMARPYLEGVRPDHNKSDAILLKCAGNLMLSNTPPNKGIELIWHDKDHRPLTTEHRPLNKWCKLGTRKYWITALISARPAPR